VSRITSRPELTKQLSTSLPLPPALRYRNFFWYWLGLVASVLGHRSFEFAQFWLIYELKPSPLYLGLLGIATGLPAIALNVVGGVAADRFNRRTLVIFTQSVTTAAILLMGVLTATGRATPIHVMVVAAVVSGVNSFNTPARISLYPLYVGREALMSAVALSSTAWQGSRVAAPALAAIVIGALGTESIYFLAGALAVILAVIMFFLPDAPQKPSGANVLTDLRVGLRFITHTPPFALVMFVTFVTSFFGASYVTVMPVFAVDVLDVGVRGQGALLTMAGIGSVLVTVIFGVRPNIKHRGLAIGGGAFLAGLSLLLFSVTAEVFGSFTIALILMFVVGSSISVFNMSVVTTLQLMVPDDLRGRVMGFFSMTWNMIPLGGLFLGAVATGFGVPAAVSTGGVIVVVGAAVPALFRREVRQSDSRS
jgi:MFS family permease